MSQNFITVLHRSILGTVLLSQSSAHGCRDERKTEH